MILNKFRNIEITSIFSKYNGINLGINYKKKTGKTINMWRLNCMLLKNNWVIEELNEKKKARRK